ncbi:MAG TPA: hypothetical protein VF253_05360 [Candidatus Limnocylindrales bacterium]
MDHMTVPMPLGLELSVGIRRRILAIDPGTERSAWLVLDASVRRFGIDPNDELLTRLRGGLIRPQVVVIEQVEGYGMTVGREVFETIHWSGRFQEAAERAPRDPGVPPPAVVGLTRRKVKIAICHDTKAKDQNVRLALIERFGGEACIRKGGALYGVAKDVWSALAIAVTYADQEGIALDIGGAA